MPCKEAWKNRLGDFCNQHEIACLPLIRFYKNTLFHLSDDIFIICSVELEERISEQILSIVFEILKLLLWIWPKLVLKKLKVKKIWLIYEESGYFFERLKVFKVNLKGLKKRVGEFNLTITTRIELKK